MKRMYTVSTPDSTYERVLPRSPLAGQQGKGGSIILSNGRTVTVTSGTFRQIIGAGNMHYDDLHAMLREVKRAERTRDPERRTRHLTCAAQMLAEATERYLASTEKD